MQKSKSRFRISQSWQIMIGLALGLILGVIFLSKYHGHYGHAKYWNHVYRSDSNDRAANCSVVFDSRNSRHG